MSSLPEAYDAVLLTGTVGAGKTTTASALSELQWAAGRVHAVVDLDQVRLLRPPPVGDPFQHEVELANLHDLARNYRAAGATRLIVAGVVEEAGEVPRYVEALGGSRLLLCRLTGDPRVVEERLGGGTTTTRRPSPGTSTGPWSSPLSWTSARSRTSGSTPPTGRPRRSHETCGPRPAGDAGWHERCSFLTARCSVRVRRTLSATGRPRTSSQE